MNEDTTLKADGVQQFTMEPRHAFCAKHGKVTESVTVMMEPGYEHNGAFCLKCYTENVIVPNCQRLTDKPSTS